MTAENRRKARAAKKEVAEAKKEVNVREEIFEIPPQGLTVAEVAKLIAVSSADVLKALFMKGIMAQVRSSGGGGRVREEGRRGASVWCAASLSDSPPHPASPSAASPTPQTPLR